MARTRIGAALGGIASGAASFFSQLGAHFRLPGFGGATSGQQIAPGRPRITLADVPAAAAEANVPIPQSSVEAWSESYICTYTDPETGETVARLRYEVEYEEGTPSSTRYSRARRGTAAMLRSRASDPYLLVARSRLGTMTPQVTCRRLRGTRKQVPQI